VKIFNQFSLYPLWIHTVLLKTLGIKLKRSVLAITNESILLFALDITEKGLGWSQQKRPHDHPDIANCLMCSVANKKGAKGLGQLSKKVRSDNL